MTGTPTCSATSLALGEPLAGSATHTRAWLLLEQPGPWGGNALLESRIDAGIAAEIDRRAAELGVRVQLIRRRDSDRGRTFFVDADERSSSVRSVSIQDPAEVLDLLGSRAGEPVGEPFVLVCTNARRDPCCGVAGRAVIRTLQEAGHDVWETSHVGGHRFAANLLTFPGALCFGRVDAESAPRVAALAADGRIDLGHYRGRCALTPGEQAADAFVRLDRSLDRLDDVIVASSRDLGDGRFEVICETAAGPVTVVVRGRDASPPRIESCGGEPVTPMVWVREGP